MLRLDVLRTTYYSIGDEMIRNFSNRETKALYEGEWVSLFQNFRQQAEKRLQILDSATDLVDLRQLPSNRFKVLIGRRTGQFSIRVNTAMAYLLPMGGRRALRC